MNKYNHIALFTLLWFNEKYHLHMHVYKTYAKSGFSLKRIYIINWTPAVMTMVNQGPVRAKRVDESGLTKTSP